MKTLLRAMSILQTLALVMVLSLGSTAMAAKNKKITDLDIAAVLEDVKTKGKINVYHWWTAGGEKQAIEAIIDGCEDTYAKQDAKSNAIPGGAGGAMVMKVKVLQQAGRSPEAFQAHPGQEIQPYLAADMLYDLTGLWNELGLQERMIDKIEELCVASDGGYYIVPVGVHKTNTIFYNIHMFEEYGIEIPDHADITWTSSGPSANSSSRSCPRVSTPWTWATARAGPPVSCLRTS